MTQRNTVIFDLGGVLLDWNPRHLYRRLFAADEAAMEHFLATVCTSAWNRQQDAGRPCAEACALLAAEHPDKAALIDAYYTRHLDMIAGAIEGTVAILSELRAREVPLYFLSNYSAETYPLVRARYDFLSWFAGGIVSGEHGVIKPDPAIYRLLIERHGIDPVRTVFIDDVAVNAEAARAFGIHPIHFSGADALRAELVELGFLIGSVAASSSGGAEAPFRQTG
ncbi:MAG TPA: HAD family phosphatase [Stellaceae bacterium]|nr:HAD family phosphatase [Stellaceae bacterium]